MPLTSGRYIGCVHNLKNDFRHYFLDAKTDGYNFVVASVTHPICCVGEINENTIIPQIENDDTILEPHEWADNVIATASAWIDVDSPIEFYEKLSVEALKKELAYFHYLGISKVMINLKVEAFSKLAKFLVDYVFKLGYSSFQVLISVPTSPAAVGRQKNEKEPCDAWKIWRDFRTLCGNHYRLSMAFQLDNNLAKDPYVLKRWLGEPIAALTMKTTLFARKNNNVSLTEAHVIKWMKDLFGTVRCQAIVEPCYEKRFFKNDPYLGVLEGLWEKKIPTLLRRRAIRAGCEYDERLAHELALPMTPLSQSLLCETYLHFEADIAKYNRYKKAVVALLFSRQFTEQEKPRVVMVLGAGRGPLVTAVLDAYKESNPFINQSQMSEKIAPIFPDGFKVYAVEKNFGAIPTLIRLNRTKWENRVIIVNKDMREFQPDEKADLIVSELLGSFGDNELSPECLDGANHLLNDNCVSMPCCCQSFLAPVHSTRLIAELKKKFLHDRNPSLVYESVYVSWIVNSFEIDEAKMVFEFKHPNFKKHTNDRDVNVEFVAKETSELAGFAGYFYAQLCGDVYISTVPETHTLEMGSWSPLVVPLREPVLVPKGEKIVLNMRRRSDSKQVWYEWKLKKPIETTLQNVDGRFYSMSLKSPSL